MTEAFLCSSVHLISPAFVIISRIADVKTFYHKKKIVRDQLLTNMQGHGAQPRCPGKNKKRPPRKTVSFAGPAATGQPSA